MVPVNLSDSIILLTDSLLWMSWWGILGISGMVLTKFLSVFTRSVGYDCLVLNVAKDKLLFGSIAYSNWSILKSTILLLARYESPFLFGLFMNKLINSVVNVFFTCIFRNYRFYEFIINMPKLVRLCCFAKLLIRVKTLLSRSVSSKLVMDAVAIVHQILNYGNNTGTLLIKIALNRAYRNHYFDSRFTLTVMMPEMMPQSICC